MLALSIMGVNKNGMQSPHHKETQQEIFKFHSFYIHFVDCLAIPPVTKLFFKHPYKPDLYLTPEKANTPLNLGTPTTPARDENKA